MKNRIIGVILAVIFGLAGTTTAKDVVTLHKTFVQLDSPHEEVVVGVEVSTKLEHQEGGRKSEEKQVAQEKNDLLVHMMNKAGWKENDRIIDDITAKSLEMVIEYRTRVFIRECDDEIPYRSEDMKEYFGKIISKMEDCIIYNNRLK